MQLYIRFRQLGPLERVQMCAASWAGVLAHPRVTLDLQYEMMMLPLIWEAIGEGVRI